MEKPNCHICLEEKPTTDSINYNICKGCEAYICKECMDNLLQQYTNSYCCICKSTIQSGDITIDINENDNRTDISTRNVVETETQPLRVVSNPNVESMSNNQNMICECICRFKNCILFKICTEDRHDNNSTILFYRLIFILYLYSVCFLSGFLYILVEHFQDIELPNDSDSSSSEDSINGIFMDKWYIKIPFIGLLLLILGFILIGIGIRIVRCIHECKCCS